MLADCRTAHPVETMHLRGLSPTAVEALASNWPKVSPDLVRKLRQLTDGNPLFLDELLRQVGERGDQEGGERDTPVRTDLSPTESIRELVARRVSRLPEDVIHLLQAAAVAGPECEAGIVAEAAELAPDRWLDAFDLVEDCRLLRRIGDGFHDRYAFRHASVREAIYGELLRGRRALPPQDRGGHRAAARRRARQLSQRARLPLLLGCGAGGRGQGGPLLPRRRRACVATARLRRGRGPPGPQSRRGGGVRPARPDGASQRRPMALAEAQNRVGEAKQSDANFKQAALLARATGDAERLATVAFRAVPMSFN